MRTKFIWAVLAVVLALAAWALMTPPAEPGRIGVNRLVENEVTTTAAGQSDWRPSVIGADVNFGDRVATAAASRLEVSLLDRSVLTVGANARLDIDRFVYDPERGVAGVAVSVVRGAFRFVSDNRGAQPEPIAFRTPGSAIGIRGTMIEGLVGPEAVTFLAGIPGAPDLSAEADSAAVIILRQGAIGIAVNGQSVVLDRPVQMVALTRTRLYPAFAVSDETTRRFEILLPSRRGPADPPPAPVVESPSPTATPAPSRAPNPVAVTPSDGKPAGAATPPPVRDPPVRLPPAGSAPVAARPTTRDPPVRIAPAPRTAQTLTAPPTRAPLTPPVQQPRQTAPGTVPAQQ